MQNIKSHNPQYMNERMINKLRIVNFNKTFFDNTCIKLKLDGHLLWEMHAAPSYAL